MEQCYIVIYEIIEEPDNESVIKTETIYADSLDIAWEYAKESEMVAHTETNYSYLIKLKAILTT